MKRFIRSRRRRLTKADKHHRMRLEQIGCIVADENCGGNIEPHHVTRGDALGKRSGEREILPLCGNHHNNGIYGVSIHAGKETWVEKHGTEQELLEKVNELVREMEEEASIKRICIR